MQIVNPVFAGIMYYESGFKLSMQTLYHTVGCWLIRVCSDSLATQDNTQFGEKRRLKLGTAIGCGSFWFANSSNPDDAPLQNFIKHLRIPLIASVCRERK